MEHKLNIENPEVFAIKGLEAFIGGKLENGNFWFTSVTFTEPQRNTNPVPDDVLKELFNAPVYMVTPPKSEYRQQVWAETYKYFLTHPAYGWVFAKDYADKAVAEFDKLFTQKTQL